MKGFLAVACVACIIIFYQFNAIPAHLTFDEVEFARLAVMLDYQSYIPYTEYATGHATMYFYAILASFKLFGLHEIALRLPSALFGVGAGLVMYAVARELFPRAHVAVLRYGKKHVAVSVGLLVALLFVSMRWFFGFARFSFEGTLVLLLELVSLYGILRAMRSRSAYSWIVLSALGSGLAFNSYQPGRFFFIIPILGMILVASIRRIQYLLVFLGVFGVLIAPLTLHLIQHPDVRVKQQLYLQDENLSTVRKAQFFADNVWRNTKLFFVEGDASGRHNYPFKPALELPIALLGLWGLGVALSRWRDPKVAMMLVYACIGMGPTLLTYPHENPNMLRTITVLPSLVFFVGLAVMDIYHRSKQRAVVGAVLVVLVAGSVVADLRTYFVFQKRIFPQAFEVVDRFGGVYFFMKERGYDINHFRIPADQIDKFNSVPGPLQIYRNQ